MALQRKQWMMIGGAVVAVLLLSLAPRAPKQKAEGDMTSAQAGGRVSEDPNSGSTPHAEEAMADGAAEGPVSKDPEVNAILSELKNGAPPMQTILKLKKFADEHPDNIEAQYHLGVFSWQTGQYDKSMERFRKVIAMDPKGYPDAYAFLAQAYGSLDSTDKAIAAIETYKTLVTDTALRNGADRFLTDLRTKKNH